MDEYELNYAVPLFLCEVRKTDGSEYPPETLRQLVASLQKHLETQGRSDKLLSDPKFKVPYSIIIFCIDILCYCCEISLTLLYIETVYPCIILPFNVNYFCFLENIQNNL